MNTSKISQKITGCMKIEGCMSIPTYEVLVNKKAYKLEGENKKHVLRCTKYNVAYFDKFSFLVH